MGDFSIGANRGTVEPWVIREDDVFFKLKLHMLREKMKWTVAALDAQLRLAPMSVPTTTEVPARSALH